MLAKFTARGMEQLNLMDLSSLRVLEIGFNMPSKTLNSFIEAGDLPSLEELVIR